MIIGIFGQKEHGKSTFAKLLKDELEIVFNQPHLINEPEDYDIFEVKGFASKIKEIICEVFGITTKQLDEYKTVGNVPPDFLVNMRIALQYVGQCFRDIKPTVWIDYLLNKHKNNNLIIDDGRYFNEAEAIKQSGGYNIFIYRPEKSNTDPHLSEKEMSEVINSIRAFPDGKNAFFQRYFNQWVANTLPLNTLKTIAHYHAKLIFDQIKGNN